MSDGYWWCPHCVTILGDGAVTICETCVYCGTEVEYRQDTNSAEKSTPAEAAKEGGDDE